VLQLLLVFSSRAERCLVDVRLLVTSFQLLEQFGGNTALTDEQRRSQRKNTAARSVKHDFLFFILVGQFIVGAFTVFEFTLLHLQELVVLVADELKLRKSGLLGAQTRFSVQESTE